MTVPHTASQLLHLDWLKADAILILCEAVAKGRNPVMLLSVGKETTVTAHLAPRAFCPSPPPFPLLHVDPT